MNYEEKIYHLCCNLRVGDILIWKKIENENHFETWKVLNIDRKSLNDFKINRNSPIIVDIKCISLDSARDPDIIKVGEIFKGWYLRPFGFEEYGFEIQKSLEEKIGKILKL